MTSINDELIFCFCLHLVISSLCFEIHCTVRIYFTNTIFISWMFHYIYRNVNAWLWVHWKWQVSLFAFSVSLIPFGFCSLSMICEFYHLIFFSVATKRKMTEIVLSIIRQLYQYHLCINERIRSLYRQTRSIRMSILG